LFAFLQSGVDGKGQLSLGRIVPTNTYAAMQDKSLEWYHAQIEKSEDMQNKFIDQYAAMFNSMYKVTVEDENAQVIEVDTSIRPIIKVYGSFYTFDPGSRSFITPTTYRSDLRVYNIRSMKKAEFIASVKKEIQQAKKAGKTKVFVVNNTRPSDEVTKSESHSFYAPSILIDLVESGEIEAKNVFGISVKKKERYSLLAEDMLTDKTYTQNTDLIEKQLQELKSLAEDPNVEVVFDVSGVGLPLLGYGKTEAPIVGNIITPYTGKVQKTNEGVAIFNSPAPKTYVYLSKRLYEIFGYVNQYLTNIGPAIKEAKELRAEMVGKEQVTNAEVQEVIKNCLINTLG